MDFGIVLNNRRFGETSHILQILTRTNGLLTFMVKGSSRRSVLNPLYRQPFTILEMEYTLHANREFQFLREAVSVNLLDFFATNPAKNGICLFLSEVLSKIMRQQPADERLFDFVRSSIDFFVGNERGTANFHLVFLIKLTYFLGFFPNLSDFSEGVLFDMTNSRFVPLRHDSHTLNVHDTEVFAQLMRMDYVNMHLFKMSGTERTQILRKIIEYYRLHLPNFGEIRSLDVLSDMCR